MNQDIKPVIAWSPKRQCWVASWRKKRFPSFDEHQWINAKLVRFNQANGVGQP